MAQMFHRLRTACEEDMEWQRGMLRSVFQMALEPRGAPLTQAAVDAAPTHEISPSERRRLEAHVAAIGESLARLALANTWGTTWLTNSRPFPKLLAVTAPVNPDPWLYSGAAGVALFLANHAAHTGERRNADLAQAALRYCVSTTSWLLQSPFRHRPPAFGMNGIFSSLYVVAECGRILNIRIGRTFWIRVKRRISCPVGVAGLPAQDWPGWECLGC